MNETIIDYYDNLAKDYDHDRFSNSYGRFIDYQERRVLSQWNVTPSGTVDLACGTGRLTDFAEMGVDASEGMLAEARKRHVAKHFICAPGQATTLPDESVDTVISFHLMMHLEPSLIQEIGEEMARILRPGGRFIFDIPSQCRRALLGKKRDSWHGSTGLDLKDVEEIFGGKFAIKRRHGIMMLPVHHLPKFLRKPLRSLDYALCGSMLKSHSSYVVYELIKR
ncbi:MAG: class I SAM-dependent methyltransferase [Bacteroidales bacterium]|nr:class I SAM-dependent methyltransferase [Bacteroidales bacterium]